MRHFIARHLHRLCLPALLLLGVAGARAQSAWPLWNAYSARFIDAQGRVIDPHRGEITTSEGQSYALFFALVQNDRPTFNRVLAWTRDNLAAGDMGARLPGWKWGKDKAGNWKLLDAGSAADSDCWIAYSVLEAGRLWNEPAYTALAHKMLGLIARQEVTELPGFGVMLMPGATENWTHQRVWTVNASYLPLFVIQRFAEADAAGPWEKIAGNIPLLLSDATRRGFAMDWNDYTPGQGFQPAPPPGPSQAAKPTAPAPAKLVAPTKSGGMPPSASSAAMEGSVANPGVSPSAPAEPTPQPAVGSYDAIRVYLWAGMLDSAAHGRSAVLNSLAGMGAYLADHDAPPEKVDADGTPLAQDGPVGFSAAVLPYLDALPNTAKAVTEQRARLSAQLDPATGLYGKDPAYYDQNLTLFATGFLAERFRFSARGELMVEWKQQ